MKEADTQAYARYFEMLRGRANQNIVHIRKIANVLRPLQGRIIVGGKPVVAPATQAYHRLICHHPSGMTCARHIKML